MVSYNKTDESTIQILNALNDVHSLLRNSNDKDSDLYFRSQLNRYYYSLRLIYKYMSSGTSVDIGNYPGHIQAALTSLGIQAYGLDIDPDRYPIELKDSKSSTIKWNFETESYTHEKSFDNAICLEVLEHLHSNPLNLFKNLHRIININGKLLISTPNLFSLSNRIKMFKGQEFLEHPFSVYGKLEKFGSIGHQRLYTKNEVINYLEAYGFNIEKVWIINNSSPLLSYNNIKHNLNNFDYEYFSSLFKENYSIKSRIKSQLESILNPYFSNFYDNIFILASLSTGFNKDKFIDALKKSDPWLDTSYYEENIN